MLSVPECVSEGVRPVGSLPGLRGRGTEWGKQELLRPWCSAGRPGLVQMWWVPPPRGGDRGKLLRWGQMGVGFREGPISICSVFSRKRRPAEEEQRLGC